MHDCTKQASSAGSVPPVICHGPYPLQGCPFVCDTTQWVNHFINWLVHAVQYLMTYSTHKTVPVIALHLFVGITVDTNKMNVFCFTFFIFISDTQEEYAQDVASFKVVKYDAFLSWEEGDRRKIMVTC